MKFTQHQKQVILDAIVAVDEERIRLQGEVSECVTHGIKLRAHQDKLDHVRGSLANLLKPSDRVPPKKLPKLPVVPELQS